MTRQSGIARYHKGNLYFDEKGWDIIQKLARKKHKSHKKLVIEAVKRYIARKNKGVL